MAGMFRPINELIQIESFNRGSDLAAILIHIPVGELDPFKGRLPVNQAFPVSFFSNPHRGNWSNPRNDHTFLKMVHVQPLSTPLPILIDVLPFVKAKTPARLTLQ